MNHTLFFFFCKYLHRHVFPKIGQRLNCFCHVYSFWLCQTHLRCTKAHSKLGDQIACTVGHGAPGTFELMNYHLLHVKCHYRFMPLEQDEFSISATIFSQWHDNVISQPTSIVNENQNLLYPKISLSQWLQVERVSFGR